MRKINSIKNAIIAVLMNVITILIGFIAQKVFVVSLGKEYLGLNGLFNNILSILAVVELGFGNAIIYHLYRPISENNQKEITILMQFYKKTYRIIAGIIFVLGLIVMPFLKYIVGEINIKNNLYLLFFLALFDIIASYLLTYKRSILYADQKTYIVNIVHIGYIVLMNFFEIILLIFTQNYIIYLLVKIIFRILENIVITIIANKKYPFINNKVKNAIDVNLKTDILKKVRGLLFHRIGSSLVLGTDNIIISRVLGVVTVGLYSNYNMIIQAVTNLLGQIFNSITASIGNLLIERDHEKSFDIYNKMLFLNSWLYCFCSVCLICLIQPFIIIWMGNDYLLSYEVLCVLIINFYVQGMRKTSNTFKEAAGIFYEDRFVPLIESLVNILLSIILAKSFGLIGVFIGTFLSSLVLFLYSYPIFVYKKLFNKKYINFINVHLKYLLASIFITIITILLINCISISNLNFQLLINTVICIIVPNFLYIILFIRSTELKYYLSLVKQLLKNKSIST